MPSLPRWLMPKKGDKIGQVTLVGAGPGDPDLLTLGGLKALQQADVVFYDALVSPEILALIPERAEKISVGKRAGNHSKPQSEINDQLVEAAKMGLHIVRLKGGDPMLFGRADEEIDACAAANIPVQIIAGVSAMSAAAVALGHSLTSRHDARRVVISAGHDAKGSLPPKAGPSDTTHIIYMPKGEAAGLKARFLSDGYGPKTSCALVLWASLPQQKILRGSLEDLEHLAQQAGDAPALLIIGGPARF